MPLLLRTLFALFAVVSIAWADELGISNDVNAVLADNCFKCHGEKKKSGKLDLRTINSMLAGGKRGTAIVPGDASNSRLIELIQPGAKPHMPPGKNQLEDAAIKTLTKWIDSLPSAAGSTKVNNTPKKLPTPKHWTPPTGLSPTTVIDFLIEDGYTQRTATPNPPTSDSQFVRRLYIDLIARIPTSKESDAFLNSTDSIKRTALIEQLLTTDEFATRMADAFDTMLMGRSERRLKDRKEKGWHAFLFEAFKENRPWNEVAREVLLARGESKQRGHIWYLHERRDNHQDIAEAIAKGFFGVDIACAQCHDHPLAGEIHQSHYWGLVAFFNRGKNANSENGIAIAESAVGGFNDFANALEGTTEQASLVFLDRPVVEEQRPENVDKQEDKDELYIQVANEPRVPKFSRREKFVDEMLDDHPLLARAMVNRIWAMMMGRGIVHPAEKMDSDHPPSHPVLLDWLARDFEASGYNAKRLIRAIMMSKAYQLQSRTIERMQPDSFAFGLEKPLTAEAYLNSLAVVLDLKENEKAELGKAFRTQFPDVIPENNLTNLKQTMMLTNGSELHAVFEKAVERMNFEDGIVERVHSLYARVFGRKPNDDELFAVGGYLRSRKDRPKKATAQVLWAMVTSAEFRFNH